MKFAAVLFLGISLVCVRCQSDDDEGLEDSFTTNILTNGGFFPGSRCVFPWSFMDSEGNEVVFNSCKPFSELPKPLLEGTNGEDPYTPASDNVADSTGGILAWCPHNYEESEVKRFYPGDKYQVAESQIKRHWGFCECTGETFWQRLPEFKSDGSISTSVSDSRRLNTADCLLNTTITPREEKFYSIDCKAHCDATKGCNGFEYMRDEDFNHCNILSCIQVIDERPDEKFIKYKKQVKRPCSQATSNLFLQDGQIFPFDIITTSPTASPVVIPPSTDPIASAPTDTDTDSQNTLAPTSAPALQNPFGSTPPPTNAAVNPAAWAVPITLIAVAGAGVAVWYVRKRNQEEPESFPAGGMPKAADPAPENSDAMGKA